MSDTSYQTLPLLFDAAVATGLGLLIGLEREHHEIASRARVGATATNGSDSLLGVRTFALLALFGWLTAYSSFAHPWLPLIALLMSAGLITVAALKQHEPDRGFTTEVAAMITVLLGMVVHHQRSIAVAVALATTLLLMAKPFFRELIPRLSRVDLTATLQLLILFAIVLPLLPEEARDPWRVLSPRRLGVFVALVAGIGYVGYVLHRILGARQGAWLTGLVGGLVSSTAVTAAMAQQARRLPALARPGQLATMLASTVMFVRVVVVASMIDMRITMNLLVPFAPMAVCTLGAAVRVWRKMRSEDVPTAQAQPVELDNPFSLLPALKWGALLAVILVASAMARESFGDSGFVATAGLSGLVDVDAMTIIATRAMTIGEIGIDVASLAITVAVASNTVVKTAIALVAGGRKFGVEIAIVFGLATVVGVAAAVLI